MAADARPHAGLPRPPAARQHPLPRLRAATLTALGFSWLGDSVPDLTSGDGAFIAMVACFLCAQVAFIVGLLPHWLSLIHISEPTRPY